MIVGDLFSKNQQKKEKRKIEKKKDINVEANKQTKNLNDIRDIQLIF